MKNFKLGLPENIRMFWVERESRTNPLSHQEGGYDVIVVYKHEDAKGYDWIKFPPAYLKAIRRDMDQSITAIYQSIYFRISTQGGDESEEYPFIKLWDADLDGSIKDFMDLSKKFKSITKNFNYRKDHNSEWDKYVDDYIEFDSQIFIDKKFQEYELTIPEFDQLDIEAMMVRAPEDSDLETLVENSIPLHLR